MPQFTCLNTIAGLIWTGAYSSQNIADENAEIEALKDKIQALSREIEDIKLEGNQKLSESKVGLEEIQRKLVAAIDISPA